LKLVSNTNRILLYFFAIIFCNSIFAQISNTPGIPFIKNFTEEETKSNLTIYDISQGGDGEMYFAISGALLVFDGVRWKKYSYGVESDLRSVFYKDDKHIYTGGHGGFGYWSKNSTGILEYNSLFFKQPKKDDTLLPIFYKIVEINGKILFQTWQQIYIYDPKTSAIESMGAIRGFNELFSSENRAFIQDYSGLFEINNKELVQIDGTYPEQFHIKGVFVNTPSKLLIITKNKGVWTLDDGKLRKNDWEVNGLLEKYLVNDVQKFEDDKLIIGTIRNGVYIISKDGEVLLQIDKNDGISKNAIRKVFTDVNNNLWLGMDNGLSYIQTNSNTNYLLDAEGEFGTVYTSFLKDSLLYLGTNQGLFVKNWRSQKSIPKLIDKDVGQIWSIDEVDGQILVGSHQGISIIKNKKLETLHIDGGAWIFRKHPIHNDLMYVGFYSGISLFKRINSSWVFIKKLQNYGESSRFMEFDKYGFLWVAHPSKGYYRLNLPDDGQNLRNVEFYGIDNEFVDTFAYLSKIDNDIVFHNPKGFFNYDPIDNTFVTANYISKVFKDLKDVNVITQNENIFWYSTPGSLGYILRNGNKFGTINQPFYSIRNKHLNDFNKFSKLNDSVYGIGLKEGMLFHTINKQDVATAVNIPPEISYIRLIGTSDTILAPINNDKELEIPNKNNFIKIGLAFPKTPLSSSPKIQYRLKGHSDDWSKWDYTSELSFPGLSSGNYLLELRSGGENQMFSTTIARAFYVRPPWYLTKIAFIIYALFILLLNVIYRSYFKAKSKKQIAALKKEEAEKRQQQEDKFKLDRLEAERKMLKLKEENLSFEIKKKNYELASSTLNNIKKNELLTELVKDITKINEKVLNSSLHSPIKKVIKKINNHLVDKEDWLAFELHFRNAHTDFFDKLREKHPDLSSNDIKLSAYLKLNLSSKEIASLMNISIRSVEQSRWRLRKNLNLSKESSLVNYIQSF
jgi:DNA-binding CsgD family transcriptional regulator